MTEKSCLGCRFSKQATTLNLLYCIRATQTNPPFSVRDGVDGDGSMMINDPTFYCGAWQTKAKLTWPPTVIERCVHCNVAIQKNGDAWQHTNGLVSCYARATKATPPQSERFATSKAEASQTGTSRGPGMVVNELDALATKIQLEAGRRPKEPREQ